MKPTHTSIEHLEARIAPAGLVLAVYDPATHELALTGDDLDNKIAIFQISKFTWRIEGRDTAGLDPVLETAINVLGETQFDVGTIAKLTIATAGGNDRLEITNLTTLTSVNVDTGAGDDSVKTEGFVVKGNAFFATGAGVDTVEFDGLVGKISGNLGISDTADGLTFTFRAEQATVGGSVTYVGSSAADILTMTTDTMLKIGKRIDFTANGGSDRLTFGSEGTISIGRDAMGRSIIYNGGIGNDRIAIGSSSVSILGSVEMTGDLGNDRITLDGLKISVGKSRAGVSVQLVGGDGKDQIGIHGSTVKVGGLVSLDGGLGDDLLDLSGNHNLTLKGGAHFDGGAGFDEFKVGADNLLVTGNFLFEGGDDFDQADIEANGSIKGAVTLHLGGALIDEQFVGIRGRSGLPNSLKITGAVTADTTGDAATTDLIKLTNVSIGGALTVSLGEGASSVDFDNVNAGAVSIDTRGGNDDVVIEGDGNYGISTFRKLATILLGVGDDSLTIGDGSEDNLVRFLANIIADGGDGTDTRSDLVADNSSAGVVNLTDTAFEVVLPPS